MTIVNLTDEEKDMLRDMKEYAERMLRACEAFEKGEKPIYEAFNEVFLENRSEHNRIKSKIARMIEHLLKFGYCDSRNAFNRNRDEWTTHFNNHKNEALEYLEWTMPKRYTNLVNWVEANIQEIYKGGIGFYERDSKIHGDLKAGLKLIPEECPWTLTQLMDEKITTIVSMLPNQNSFLLKRK